MRIQKNKTYTFEIDNIAFGDVPKDRLPIFFQDGRVASFFLEEQLQYWFPELTRIEGNLDHDHVDREGREYDAKSFTKHGMGFMPSKQRGVGRKFDAAAAHSKAEELCYICCDIVEFPMVRIKFIDGKVLVKEYPKCAVPKGKREVLFG